MPLNFGGGFLGGGTEGRFIRNKVKHLSITPADWQDVVNGAKRIDVFAGRLVVGAGLSGVNIMAPIHLPAGSIITDCIVQGNTDAEDRTWTMRRANIKEDTTVTLATAAVNTKAVSTDHVIDNELFHYSLAVDNLGDATVTEEIFGSIITYVVPIDFADQGAL